jgi:hypothetical protein
VIEVRLTLTPLGPCTKCDAPVYEELRRQRRQFLCFDCDETFVAALHWYAVRGSPATCSEECCRGREEP